MLCKVSKPNFDFFAEEFKCTQKTTVWRAQFNKHAKTNSFQAKSVWTEEVQMVLWLAEDQKQGIPKKALNNDYVGQVQGKGEIEEWVTKSLIEPMYHQIINIGHDNQTGGCSRFVEFLISRKKFVRRGRCFPAGKHSIVDMPESWQVELRKHSKRKKRKDTWLIKKARKCQATTLQAPKESIKSWNHLRTEAFAFFHIM